MVEITKSINRSKFLAWLINSSFKSFFYCIRKINKAFAKDSGNLTIISLHKLGDTIFTIPAIKAIQKKYKQKIIICCFPEAIPIYRLGLINVEYFIINHNDFFFNGRVAKYQVRLKFKILTPQFIIDLTGAMTSATLIFNSRAKKIIGMNREQFKTIYDKFTPIKRKPHLMDIYLDVASLIIPNIDRDYLKRFNRTDSKNKKILVHPFAGWKAKELGILKFIKFFEQFSDKYSIHFIAPKNMINYDILKEINNKNIKVIETNSIEELISNIRDCSVFFGNDSGPIHIAEFLGKPTFTIFGPTNPAYPSGVGDHHKYYMNHIKCSPSENEFCFTNGGRSGCPSFECMEQIKIEDLKIRFERFLKEINFV